MGRFVQYLQDKIRQQRKHPTQQRVKSTHLLNRRYYYYGKAIHQY